MVKPKAPSSLRVLRGNPLYRGVTVAEFRSALGASAAAPQIASFLVKELDASLFVVMLARRTGAMWLMAGAAWPRTRCPFLVI
ncbi:hypothetical protein [Streptomyces sp. NPDC056337]|uniref:hypothetical protein n=1 Tax=Streptomyces sp. NPDC056337 TaxID=3345787 RepID=UPI0035DD43C3